MKGHGKSNGASVLDDESAPPAHSLPRLSRAVRVTCVGLVLWFAPILAVGIWLGWEHTLFREGIFFSKAAVVTFGGAYAILPYVAQQAISHYGWLKPRQMMDGLGLAETTTGPLIMVVQFVGFWAAGNIRRDSHRCSPRPLPRCSLPGLLLRLVFFGCSSVGLTSRSYAASRG
jgi:chromate transporter